LCIWKLTIVKNASILFVYSDEEATSKRPKRRVRLRKRATSSRKQRTSTDFEELDDNSIDCCDNSKPHTHTNNNNNKHDDNDNMLHHNDHDEHDDCDDELSSDASSGETTMRTPQRSASDVICFNFYISHYIYIIL
jgi:hypothetical protein